MNTYYSNSKSGQQISLRLSLMVALLLGAPSVYADTIRWLGDAPFCAATVADCDRLGMSYVRTHASGDGDTCLTGAKVMCRLLSSTAAGKVASCPYNAASLKQTLTCKCTGKDIAAGTVWGSDTYTSDSNICRAARHAGVIPAAGGVVTLTKKAGLGSYTGSKRNGITTNRYGRWVASYSFTR